MGFFKSLFGLGIAAGTAYAGVKIAKKYQENKSIDDMAKAAGEAPIKRETSEVIGDVAKAATEVFQETGEKVKDTFCDVKDKFSKYDNGYEMVEDIADEVKDKAETVAEVVKDKAETVAEVVREKVGDVADSVKDKAEEVKEAVKDANEDDGNE